MDSTSFSLSPLCLQFFLSRLPASTFSSTKDSCNNACNFLQQIEAISCKDSEFVIDLSGDWSFYMGPAAQAEFASETVHLPGTMDENHKGIKNINNLSTRHLNRDYVYTGPAVYQRTITIPTSWSGRPVYLELERTKKSRVWIDDVSVGPQQKSFTTPHRYDLSPFCQPGMTHILTIEVDNSALGMPHAMYSTLIEGEAWSHQITEYTQTNWNGIIGQIRLYAPPAISVFSVQLRPDVSTHSVRFNCVLSRTAYDEDLYALIRLCAKSWNTAPVCHQSKPQWIEIHFPAGRAEVKIHITHDMGDTPLLWDEFRPNMYQMEVSLYTVQNGSLYCTKTVEDFGMRSFTTGAHDGGKQFFINGRPTILRGEINCAVFPQTGYPPMDLASWLRIFRVYKNYGLNHVRFHTWIPPRNAFKAADQLGLYLYIELPHWGRRMFGDVYQGDFTDVDYYKNDTRKIFSEYLNSPSFVMFALGNEERIGFYYYEEFLKFCKHLEPHLLYSDIAGHSTYPPSADFAAKFLNPEYLPLVNGRNDWDYSDAVQHAPIAITGHEVGQLQVYPDYDKELSAYETAVLKPRNLEYFKKILAQVGLSERSADFSRATGKLAAMLYRHFAESYLRTPGAGGFTLLGLQDFPGQGTALVGLLDSFLKSKGAISAKNFRQSCCELTILAEMPKFVWNTDETFTAKIMVANYSASSVCSDVLWSVDDENGHSFASGYFPHIFLQQGSVTVCGHIEAGLNRLVQACALQLKLKLSSTFEAPYAPGTNEYPIWCYPAQQVCKLPKNIRLFRAYGIDAQQALAKGETVLIISEGTSSALPFSRAVTFRPDFWSPMFHTDSPDGYSLGIFAEKSHPLFSRFPTDIFGDWQWYEPLQGARALLINRFSEALRPIVQPIATIDLPERLALMFEARIGTGRLFVCTIDLLKKQDAASRQLLQAIYAYVSSADFSPCTVLSSEILCEYLPPLDLIGIRLKGASTLQPDEYAHYTVVFIDSHGICSAPKDVDIIFHSSASSVASISSAGLVHGLQSGISKITAVCVHGNNTFRAEIVVKVGEKQAVPLSLSDAVLSASSTNPEHPISNLVSEDRAAFWQSDYLDRTQRMPQWLSIELTQEATVCALLCGAWHGHSRGAILKATVCLSKDGVQFEDVCHCEWDERTILDDRLFSFTPQPARFIRLKIEWSVMHTGDSNAVSISHLALYDTPIIASAEACAACEVRYGTPFEKALIAANLPAQIPVTLTNGKTAIADVVWSCETYHPDIPSIYRVSGTLFVDQVANPANICAQKTIRVLPKDMTTPPNKAHLYKALARIQTAIQHANDSSVRMHLELLLTQAESFNALTGAVQHDVDVLVEKLSDAINGLEVGNLY